MNTRILFYCTSVDRHGFSKIIFESILPEGIINSTEDANDWVDNNISNHYDKFYLEFVIDWFVSLYEPTTAELKDTEIFKTIQGKLVFEDESDYHYLELGRTVSEKNKAKAEIKKLKTAEKLKKETVRVKKEDVVNQKKNYPSIWIEPSGEVHTVGFANHNEFARDWLIENDKETYDEVNSHSIYDYEVLQNNGWIRILGWTDPPTFVITERVTPKQRISLKDYCLGNDVPYQAFPEILKS
jgi:hypothetical protein